MCIRDSNNTPYKFNYQYDSTGQYLGWKYEFTREGEWISFYKEDSTKVASIFHVKDSLLNGLSTQFYLSGKIQSEFEFYNRENNGFVRYWNEAGKLTLEHQYEYRDYGHYQSSIRIGTWRDWDDNGNLIKLRQFENNELHGSQLEFYENGQIKVEEFYKTGERDSTLTKYHSNGQIFKQIRFIQGEFIKENPNYEYHPNGGISGKGNLEQERKEGLWKYYFENGARESEGNYGTYVYDHDHGDIIFYHKQGQWKYWHLNGEFKAIGTYNDVQIQDVNFGGDPNTGLGVRSDDWKYYNEQGIEITHEIFIKRGFSINDN